MSVGSFLGKSMMDWREETSTERRDLQGNGNLSAPPTAEYTEYIHLAGIISPKKQGTGDEIR